MRRWFRRLRRRSEFERDLRAELHDHLERRTADLVQAGLSPDEAHRRARIEFGSVEAHKEQVRDMRTWRTVRNLPDQIARSSRFALRRLRHSPLFTVFAIVTLAVGIGIATASYSFIYSLARIDPGVRDRAGLVAVRQSRLSSVITSQLSRPEIEDFVRLQTVFEGVGLWTSFQTSLSGESASRLAIGEAVSGNLFHVIGVNAAIGRTILPRDDQADAPGVVVLSDAIWRKQFDTDPRVIGTPVRMGGRVFEIIGVAPPNFRGLSTFGVATSVWVPVATAPVFAGTTGGTALDRTDRERRVLSILARLRADQTLAAAKAEMRVLAQRLDAVSPISNLRGDARVLSARSAFDNSSLAALKVSALFVLSLPALVLLVACTNLANLVLSRGVSRQHEFAVLRALGSSRWRMVREQLVEGGIIATAGGAAGVFVASRLLMYMSAVADDVVGGLPEMQMEARLEPAVLVATAGLAVFALLISSLLPALQLTRTSDRQSLSADTGIGLLPKWRGRSNLIALQVTVSVALFLLTALGVTLATVDVPRDARTGFDRVAVISVPFSRQQIDEPRIRRTIDSVLEQVRALPGVERADVASLPVAGQHRSALVTSPERPLDLTGQRAPFVSLVASTPGIFRTLGTSFRSGRAFDDRDVASAAPVAVINEALAVLTFGTKDAVGRDLLMRVNLPNQTVSTVRIVGVVEDTVGESERIDHALYVPFAQRFVPDVVVVATSTTGDVDSLVTAMRTTLRQVDPDVAVSRSGSADEMLRPYGYGILRMLVGAAGSLAVIALVLSMTGLYGVLSHVVSKRTRELGLRMALGADQRRIAAMILKDGFRPVLEGLFIGLGAAAILRMLLQPSFTAPIAAFDLVAFAFAAVPLLVAGAVACYLPARRAASVEPNVALRNL